MPAPIDITGQRFGRWTVLSLHCRKRQVTSWLCVCDCGRQKIVNQGNLRQGKTRSCGCLGRELNVARSTKHGQKRRGRASGAYITWQMMITRCSNPNFPNYKYYGGRGIIVCERWRSFENFLADMGPRPEGYTIERVDVDGAYEPANCLWIARGEQTKNRRPFKRGPNRKARLSDQAASSESRS